MQEQRICPRIPVRFKLDQFIVQDSAYSSMQGNDLYLDAEAIDLSEGGIGCLLSGAVEPLAQVFLMFSLPGGGRRISCEGFVAHPRAEGGRCEAGVEFQGLSPDDRSAIAAYVASVATE